MGGRRLLLVARTLLAAVAAAVVVLLGTSSTASAAPPAELASAVLPSSHLRAAPTDTTTDPTTAAAEQADLTAARDEAQKAQRQARRSTGPSGPQGPKSAQDTEVNVNLRGLTNKPSTSVSVIIALSLLSLLPAILLTCTSFTKILVVLSLTRNALGLQQTPPNQVLAGLALFLSLFIMTPVLAA